MKDKVPAQHGAADVQVAKKKETMHRAHIWLQRSRSNNLSFAGGGGCGNDDNYCRSFILARRLFHMIYQSAMSLKTFFSHPNEE